MEGDAFRIFTNKVGTINSFSTRLDKTLTYDSGHYFKIASSLNLFWILWIVRFYVLSTREMADLYRPDWLRKT